jgi:hypothetical protein
LLLADLATTPAAIQLGTKFTILAYSGNLSGSFSGVPEGSTLTLGPNAFIIRYADAKRVTLQTVAAGSPYDTWAAQQGLTASNKAPDQDPDSEEVPNLLEFYLDGDPLASDRAILPVATLDATHLKFTFARRDDAEAFVASQQFEWGSNLSSWTAVALGAGNSGPDANGIVVSVSENAANPDTIVVSVPRARAVAGKLFGRLRVAQ